MRTLEITKENLCKDVDPEKEVSPVDLNYVTYQQYFHAAKVVYTSPSGKVTVVKDRFGEKKDESKATSEVVD